MDQSAIVGVSAFGHDAASCLVDAASGRVLAAIAEERITGCKHDQQFPTGALRFCLKLALERHLTVVAVAIAHNAEAFITEALPRELLRSGGTTLRGAVSIDGLLQHFRADAKRLETAFDLAHLIVPDYRTVEGLSVPPKAKPAVRWYYDWALFHHLVSVTAARVCSAPSHAVPHHLAHAASAYYNSGFADATIVTLDGQGEAEAGCVFKGRNGTMESVSTSWWPNSLGALYLAATAHLGFQLGDEGKVMGMAAYGKPRYAEELLSGIQVNDEPAISFHPNRFLKLSGSDALPHCTLRFGQALEELIPKRQATGDVRQQHFDFAASVQCVLETVCVDLVKKAMAVTDCSVLALAGGVFLNARMNREIRRRSGCTGMFVFPASGDDGTAVGAAQVVARETGGPVLGTTRFSCFLAPSSSPSAETVLAARHIRFTRPNDGSSELATILAQGAIVARVTGSAEFGPRALGHRSILADPRNAGARDLLNLQIKKRETFRPFAPICPLDGTSPYFDDNGAFPFMTEVVGVKIGAQSRIPAAMHVDGSARLQTIDRETDPELYRLLLEFERCTGVAVLINTSFNVAGEPLVHSLEDALETFFYMRLDLLWMEHLFIRRTDNLHVVPPATLEELLDGRRRRNRELLEPKLDLDLSTEAAIARFRR